jgi:hypothetical protein
MQLLQLWGHIHTQAIQLADAMAGLPDEVECGDADAHVVLRFGPRPSSPKTAALSGSDHAD